MAIVTKDSPLVGSNTGSGYVGPQSASAGGEVRRYCGTITNAASDNNGSKYKIGTFPSSAILLPESLIDGEGWGYAQTVIGIEDDTDALFDALTSGLSTSGDALVTVFGSTWNKPLWKQLGLSADPGDDIELWVFTEADATGAGELHFDLHLANHV